MKAAIEAADKREAIDQMVQQWNASGVDLRHRVKAADFLFAHKQWSAAYHKALSIVRAGGIAVILGDRGNGKTQCGVELIRQACKDMKTARYIRSREVGMALRESYGGNGKSERQAIAEFVRPHLLVIDEMQERGDKDWEIKSMNLILDKRYGEMKPTVLIANCTLKQFADLMGGGVVDRLKESGGVVSFTWPSFRRKVDDGK